MSIFKSIKGLFGQTIHYKDGVRVGETWDGLIPCTKNHYDVHGNYVGRSDPGFFADQVHYDAFGRKIGDSWTDGFGVTRHYDNDGRAGTSYQGFTSITSNIFDGTDTLFDRHQLDFDSADDAFFDDSDW